MFTDVVSATNVHSGSFGRGLALLRDTGIVETEEG